MRKQDAQNEVDKLRGKAEPGVVDELDNLLKTAADPLAEGQERLFSMKLRNAKRQLPSTSESTPPPRDRVPPSVTPSQPKVQPKTTVQPKTIVPPTQPKNIVGIQTTFNKISAKINVPSSGSGELTQRVGTGTPQPSPQTRQPTTSTVTPQTRGQTVQNKTTSSTTTPPSSTEESPEKVKLRQLYSERERLVGTVSTLTNRFPDAETEFQALKTAERQIQAGMASQDPVVIKTALTQLQKLEEIARTYTAAKRLAEGKTTLKGLYDPLKSQAETIISARAPQSAQSAQQAVKTAVGLITTGLDGKDPGAVETGIGQARELSSKIEAYQKAAALSEKKQQLATLFNELKGPALEIYRATAAESAVGAQEQVKTALNLISAGLKGTSLETVEAGLEAVRGLRGKIETYQKAAALAEKRAQLETLYRPMRAIAERIASARVPEGAKTLQGQIKTAIDLITTGLSATTLQPIEAGLVQVNGLQSTMEAFRQAMLRAQSQVQPQVTPQSPPTSTPRTGGTTTTGSGPTVDPELADKLGKTADGLSLPPKDKQALVALASRPVVGAAMLESLGKLTELAKSDSSKADSIRTLLLRELKGGPLSGPAPNEKFDAAAKEILASYVDHPEVASKALNIAQTAKHPDVIAKGVKVLGPLEKKNFATRGGSFFPNTNQKVVRNALTMGGELGGDYFERMQSYYDSDKHAEENKYHNAGVSGGFVDPAKIGAAYTRDLGNALVGEDGKLGVGPQFDGIRDMMLFHPRSLQTPLPALARNVEDMRAAVSDPTEKEKYDRVLEKAGQPSGGAVGIVRKTTGKTSGPLTANDTKKSVMSAMLTPFDQGAVGSCFATAPTRDMRLTKPLDVMEDFTTIATTGKLTKGGTTLPAVTNIAPGENTLMRSWEYTLTTMGARKTNSREKKKLSTSLFGEYVGQDPANSLQALGGENKTKIVEELEKAFSFTYDPQVARGGASDGSSDKGAFVLQHRQQGTIGGTETPITSEQGFKDALQGVLVKALGSGRSRDIQNLLRKPAFITSLRSAFSSGAGSPWEWPGGGGSSDVISLLSGTQATERDLCVPTGEPDEKTKTILLSMVDKFVPSGSGSPPPFSNVNVDGIHAMNAMPGNMARLKGASPSETERNVNDTLIAPGTQIATTELELEKTVYIYDQMMDDLIIQADNSSKPALIEAKKTKPASKMTPSQIKQFITSQTPSVSSDTMDSVLLRELKSPEIVVVDTNWGSAQDHKYFVVAPDPSTGKLTMWEKAGFSGQYKKVEDEWLSNKWTSVS